MFLLLTLIFCKYSIEKKSSWRRAKTVDGSKMPDIEDKPSRTSSDLSFGSNNSSHDSKEDLVNRCNTGIGLNNLVSPKESCKKDSFDESTCKTTTALPPFKKSLDHSNRHSHYCCDETQTASLSRLIYQS